MPRAAPVTSATLPSSGCVRAGRRRRHARARADAQRLPGHERRRAATARSAAPRATRVLGAVVDVRPGWRSRPCAPTSLARLRVKPSSARARRACVETARSSLGRPSTITRPRVRRARQPRVEERRTARLSSRGRRRAPWRRRRARAHAPPRRRPRRRQRGRAGRRPRPAARTPAPALRSSTSELAPARRQRPREHARQRACARDEHGLVVEEALDARALRRARASRASGSAAWRARTSCARAGSGSAPSSMSVMRWSPR